MDVKSFIPIKENFLDKETHYKLLKWVKNDLLYNPAVIIGTQDKQYVEEDLRKVKECFINNHPDFTSDKSLTSVFWYNYLTNRFLFFLKEFFDRNNMPVQQIDTNFDITILKYEKTDHYVPNIDYHKTTPRHVSFSYILNDDFEGGDFEFHLARNEVIKIPAKENSCIMFPSNFMFPHKITEITKGTRYVIVAWMQ